MEDEIFFAMCIILLFVFLLFLAIGGNNWVEKEKLALTTDVNNIMIQESVADMNRNDRWGNPVSYSYNVDDDKKVAKAISYGPDQTKGTSDDIMVVKSEKSHEPNYKRIWKFIVE